MRALVFTSQLAGRTGGEINARQWALGLKSRGHDVIVYAPILGPCADGVRAAGIAVVADPAAVTDPPEIMFGSGINDLAALVARFPDVPVVQVSQQWDNWASFPAPLPQVVLHVAVDALNADSLANEFGVPRDRIRHLYNAVDIAQIPPRLRPLPPKPARALVFVKQNTGYVNTVLAACAAAGIAVEPVGPAVGAAIADPLAAMAAADLVVGAARIAIEAAAAGAAVLVADHRGLGGMLTSANLQRWRCNNFGRAILIKPLQQETLAAALGEYDADDAALVAARMRELASLTAQLDALEAIFAEAVRLFAAAPPSVDAARRALARYLSRHLPRHGEASPRHALRSGREQEVDPVTLAHQMAGVIDRLSALERDWMPRACAADRRNPAAGENLLADAENLDRSFPVHSIARFERVGSVDGKTVYAVAAAGGHSEHYVQHTVEVDSDRGFFSLDVRQDNAAKIRIQLIDLGQNGACLDFSFPTEAFALWPLGQGTRPNGAFGALGSGWYRLWLSVDLPKPTDRLSYIIQIANRGGAFVFAPAGESVLVRSLRLLASLAAPPR